MNDQQSIIDQRRRYDDLLTRAMRFAERFLSPDQAFEVAHDVASELLRTPPERVTGALIYVAVTRRLRSLWRSAERRASLEGAYHEAWSATQPVWADPATSLELRELQGRIHACLTEMPPAMREVFVLIRDRELSYKETAARLGVGVGTVHTQFSRATALLRQCVADYQADASSGNQSRRAQ